MALPKIHLHDLHPIARKYKLSVTHDGAAGQVELSWAVKDSDLRAGLLFLVEGAEAVHPVPYVERQGRSSNTNAEKPPSSVKQLQQRLAKLLKDAGYDKPKGEDGIDWSVHPVAQIFHEYTQEGQAKRELALRLELANEVYVVSGSEWAVLGKDGTPHKIEIVRVVVSTRSDNSYVFYRMDDNVGNAAKLPQLEQWSRLLQQYRDWSQTGGARP